MRLNVDLLCRSCIFRASSNFLDSHHGFGFLFGNCRHFSISFRWNVRLKHPTGTFLHSRLHLFLAKILAKILRLFVQVWDAHLDKLYAIVSTWAQHV